MDKTIPATDRIVWVEDDSALSSVVSDYLGQNGFEVIVVGRGDNALDAVVRCHPALILLDIMLPGQSGLDVCKQLRAAQISAPILMLTAKDEDFDKVLALEFGADDYLVKPVQPRVLLAFLRAALRRARTTNTVLQNAEFTLGNLVVSKTKRAVRLRGEPVHMSAGDFDLLWILIERAGTVVSREELLRELRGLDEVHDDRSVDARFYRLKKRFGETDRADDRLRSIRPHGYMLTTEPW